MKKKEITWVGEKNRPLSLRRPCSCGCDERDGKKGVGYLTGSTPLGNGFSIWIKSEKVYQAIRKVLRQKE